MIIEKTRLVDGITRYAREQVLPGISDKQTKMVLSMGISVLECRPETLDGVLKLPLIPKENGELDLDMVERILTDTAEEFGEIAFTVPPVPFISPKELKMKFNADDIRKMMSYLK